MKKIAILGSTGSIGTQTLEVIDYEKSCEVVALSAFSQIDLLEQQIKKYSPKIVAVMNEDKALELEKRLKSQQINTQVVTGMDGLIEVATFDEADIILTAVVGMVGLLPTIEAIKNKKTIALANKETLVTAGDLVMNLAHENEVEILPVDSEHSAIFQCLRAGNQNEVSRIILTASGGPFRTFTKEQLKNVILEQALKHPNWNMGGKITIDSATLMNKGLEVIEAKHLFNVELEQIEVVVHKESIIHSMVEYQDGSTIAQLGTPTMHHPISYALNFPQRATCDYIKKLDWTKLSSLNFEQPKYDVFPCLNLAFEALKIGGTMPAVLNASNEIVVASFLDKKISFVQIPKIIHEVMEKHININNPSLQQILEADSWAREYSKERIK
ncbi:MAG: 1-deoxy-D-xylulose-5-phosphate reductoisomerase [Epulopiscium sp. Nele67-Bin005]|nr:MAG: 1-deoxy-D-xylulose-5-phosphate reductoisomerase [Epulopiscium sp. Nele67-Bin005]